MSDRPEDIPEWAWDEAFLIAEPINDTTVLHSLIMNAAAKALVKARGDDTKDDLISYELRVVSDRLHPMFDNKEIAVMRKAADLIDCQERQINEMREALVFYSERF